MGPGLIHPIYFGRLVNLITNRLDIFIDNEDNYFALIVKLLIII